MAFKLCCSCAKIQATCKRPFTSGAPQNSDSTVSGYDDDWSLIQSAGPYLDTDYYGCSVTSGNLYSTTGGFFYELNTRPFRWSLGGYSGEHLYISDVCHRQHAQNRDGGPPTGAHYGTFIVPSFQITAPVYASGGTIQSAQIAYARVLVDSVDVTGGAASIFASIPSSIDFPVTIPFASDTELTGKSIEIDLWFRVRTRYGAAITSERIINAETTSHVPMLQDLSAQFSSVVRGIMSATQEKRFTKRVACSFDRQGPAGVSSLNLKSQAGWTFSKNETKIDMTHVSSSDRIEFYFADEVPYLKVWKTAAINKPETSFTHACKYVPQGGTNYNTLWKHQETGLVLPIWENAARNVWNPATSTVFVNESRSFSSGSAIDGRLHGWYYPAEANRLGLHDENSDTYEDFPMEITVTTS
jgi:hypothetical protein